RLHSGLLRLDRDEARRSQPLRARVDARACADLPRRAAGRSRPSGVRLPAVRRAPRPGGRGGALAGDVAEHSPPLPPDPGVSRALISSQSYAALVAAGLLSVIVFPLVALPLLAEPDALAPEEKGRAQLSA